MLVARAWSVFQSSHDSWHIASRSMLSSSAARAGAAPNKVTAMTASKSTGDVNFILVLLAKVVGFQPFDGSKSR
jgi:hypothetical protein